MFDHPYCPRLSPDLKWQFIVSDLGTFTAYLLIGIMILAYALTHRKAFARTWITIITLALFILFCGFSHLLTVIGTFTVHGEWIAPYYAMEEGLTAVVSIAFVFMLPRLRSIPDGLQIRKELESDLLIALRDVADYKVSKSYMEQHLLELTRKFDVAVVSSTRDRDGLASSMVAVERNLNTLRDLLSVKLAAQVAAKKEECNARTAVGNE